MTTSQGMTYNRLEHGIRVLFHGERVVAHCFECQRNEDITALVRVLARYNRYDVPNLLYGAWKVLVLGTDEYYDVSHRQPEHEHRLIAQAISACIHNDQGGES